MKLNIICLIFIWFGATTVSSREMECKYDYVTHTTVRYMSELNDRSVIYRWRSIDSENDSYTYEDSTEIRPDTVHLKYLSPNLYFDSDVWFTSLYFIDFAKVLKREIQMPDRFMKQFPEESTKLTERSQLVKIPVQTWDCKRTD